ncbi:MAG: lipid IV(A) 3-deoxy-D-manno-octulosonic acid transferase [Sulfuricellaceae bacterium]|jgi:3-deoxy-D-manno-octulosonic-acid transferase
MSLARFLYTLVLIFLLPLVFLRLAWRGRRQREYLQDVAERFGFYGAARDNRQPLIWLHAVSVGETRAAAPLVDALLQDYPDHRLLLTHMTPTGRATGRELFGERVQQAYLPYDYPFAVRRFLRHFRPMAGLLLETELWPNLIAACQESRLPLLLVNARLSEKSARRYARFPRLAAECLKGLAAVAAQTEDDATRLAALGAPPPAVVGNLKFDIPPPVGMLQRGRELRALFGESRPVLLLASTRDGEESMLLKALAASAGNFLTILVPRHPQRFDDVARLLEEQGIPYQRRSDNRSVATEVRVVLGDSMGEMFAYYAACDVAFVGGSLLPFGGQNLIEPCSVGVPVLIGPHTFNFTQASELAVAAGAAERVATAEALIEKAETLLADPARRAAMGEAGKAFADRHRGATRRIMELVRPLLD